MGSRKRCFQHALRPKMIQAGKVCGFEKKKKELLNLARNLISSPNRKGPENLENFPARIVDFELRNHPSY